MMKFGILAVICVVCSVFLNGCAENRTAEPTYIYAVGADEADGRITVCVFEKKKGEDRGSGEKGKPSEAKSGDAEIVTLFYTGNSVAEAMNAFFEQNSNVYTGTIKEYAVGKDLGEDGIFNFKVYLANSSKLPAKRETAVVANACEYLGKITANGGG